MTMLIGIAAFIAGLAAASVISAGQIGRSEGRMQFQVGELRRAIAALHEVVTNLNDRVEILERQIGRRAAD
jgi:hypothetical protein